MEDKKSFDVRLGQWLEKKRNEKGYSLQYVADRLGCSKTAVHCWEKGKRSMYAKTLKAYCEVLGIDLQEFIYISED